MYILESLNEYLEEVAATSCYDTSLCGDGYYQPIFSYEDLEYKRYSYKSRNNESNKKNNHNR